MSLHVVDGKLMNTREVGNAVGLMLLNGTPLDQICQIEGMPTATQIAYMRRSDSEFAEALMVALEGGGIESALVLMEGARTGKIGKNQLEAAKWVAERLAPDLFQERKTVTHEERVLSDEELAFQLQAAARSDERVRRLLASNGDLLDSITHTDGTEARQNEATQQASESELAKKRSVKKLFARTRVARKSSSANTSIKDITPEEE